MVFQYPCATFTQPASPDCGCCMCTHVSHVPVLTILPSSLAAGQTFTEAERHHWQSMAGEWEREKEKILNSLLGPSQELDFPSEAEVKLCYLYMTDVLSATRQLLS